MDAGRSRWLALPANYIRAQIRPQRLRHYHAAIPLLVVFDDRHPGAAHSQAAAVQRMGELGLALRTFESYGSAAGLEGLEIRAGGDFLVAVLARQPDFDIVSLRRRKTGIAGREHHRAEGESQAPQDVFGIGRELFELVVTVVRMGELHQLHLLELVLPDDAAH